MGILAPTAWNFSGSERNSRISSSSSTASSSPATSSKVTSGISLEETFALDLPKPMAPLRPPLMRPSTHHIMPMNSAMGTRSWSMEAHQLVVGTTESNPPGGSAAWTRRLTWLDWASVKVNCTFLPRFCSVSPDSLGLRT